MYCRELELAHEDMVREIRDKNLMSETLEKYILGIEYSMRGNEIWSQWTPRITSLLSDEIFALLFASSAIDFFSSCTLTPPQTYE